MFSLKLFIDEHHASLHFLYMDFWGLGIFFGNTSGDLQYVYNACGTCKLEMTP